MSKDWKWVPVTLYTAGVVGALVTNLIAAYAFFDPIYGVWALGAALVYDAVWLAASLSWIRYGKRDGLTKALLFGGVIGAIMIQAWAGWTEVGKLGRSIVMGGTVGDDGWNLVIGALIILRHMAMPVMGLACVHALAGLRGAEVVQPDQPPADALASIKRVLTVLSERLDGVTGAVETLTARVDRLASAPRPTARPSADTPARQPVTVTGQDGRPTDEDLADFMETTPRTIRRWRAENPPKLASAYAAYAAAQGEPAAVEPVLNGSVAPG